MPEGQSLHLSIHVKRLRLGLTLRRTSRLEELAAPGTLGMGFGLPGTPIEGQ